MSSHVVLCELTAFAVYVVYCSFFEWTFHRHLFHTPKFGYYTFKMHTLVHHQIYGAGETYHAHDDHPHKVTMDWWALLGFLGFNAPIFWVIQKVTHIPSFWAGMTAVTIYYALYESFHWAMHVPKASNILSRFAFYRYLDAHHHIHHKYMLSNLNVILPLADLVMGTLRATDGRRIGWSLRRRKVGAEILPITKPAAEESKLPTGIGTMAMTSAVAEEPKMTAGAGV